MAMPKKLDHCPRDVGCTAQIVWKDVDTGELFSMRMSNSNREGANPLPEFVPHVCTTKSTNNPTTFFSGIWRNRRTGFIRVVGPVRLQRSALKPPADQKLKLEWELVRLEKGTTSWTTIDVPDQFKADVPLYKGEVNSEA